MRGWHYESARHALAAKGVRTGYFMPFVEKTTVPIIDYPEEFHSIRQKSVVKMSPDEFLRLAKKTSEQGQTHSQREHANKIFLMSQQEYETMIRNEKKVERVKEGLERGVDIPAGYIEYSVRGGPVEHEGRHRALAARELGLKEIPVVLVRQRELKDGHWVYGEDELVSMNQAPEYKDVKRRVLPFEHI